MKDLRLITKGISKRFGHVQALKNIDFWIAKGEVVGLVGDNGAGKSTLIKIICGVYQPDEGEIIFEGEKVKWASPHEARLAGIEVVHQDLALIPLMSVSRNFFLGREPRRGRIFIDTKRMGRESLRAISEFGISLRDANQIVATLSGGERQSVSIARATWFGAKLLILDEPTAALSVQETKKVLETVRQAKEKGISVIFISHNIRHVYHVADRFTVLFHGKKVADLAKEEATIEDVEEAIVSGQTLNN